jgi:hypothetical protein
VKRDGRAKLDSGKVQDIHNRFPISTEFGRCQLFFAIGEKILVLLNLKRSRLEYLPRLIQPAFHPAIHGEAERRSPNNEQTVIRAPVSGLTKHGLVLV